MAYSGYSNPYAYGQGPNDSYANVQYNTYQIGAVVTDQQCDEQCEDNSMTRNNSNISDISGVSLSSSNQTCPSAPSPTTPTGNFHLGGYSTSAKMEYDSSSLTPSQWDSQFTTFDQHESTRWTPSAQDQLDSTRWTPNTLGWMPNSDLLKLYKFVVRNSKEPYFQLMDLWTPTPQTPRKVYLDNPEKSIKGEFPCLYPWGCTGKQNNFSRPADLERHYKNVHAPPEEKDKFHCDYSRCERATLPFTRKDHYRDHLRDFHKEDIGSAKGEKKLDKKKWLIAQKSWLAERQISAKHWRCAKCLVKHSVTYDGWECELCKISCEPERQEARMNLAKLTPKVEVMEPMEEDTDAYVARYDNTQYSNISTSSVTDYNGCDACQNTCWIWHENQWVACQCRQGGQWVQ